MSLEETLMMTSWTVTLAFLAAIAVTVVDSCDTIDVRSHETRTLTYPQFGNYHSDAFECWVVHKDAYDPNYRLTLTFTLVSLEGSSACSRDYIDIRKNDSQGLLLARLCGDQACGHVTSDSGRLYLEFRSDSSIEKLGFITEIRVTNPADWQFNDTSWQPKLCSDDSPGSPISWTLILLFVGGVVAMGLTASRFAMRARHRRLRAGAVVAVPGGTQVTQVTQVRPEAAAYPGYPTAVPTNQYAVSTGAYPVQQYHTPLAYHHQAPVTGGVAAMASAPSGALEPLPPVPTSAEYWNPGFMPPEPPPMYHSAPPPPYEEVAHVKKY